ncbi:unnamed protein product [Urochloa decumbens]|uniref:Protein FAR1-RELATED SEQUENCE n=1 Tax=Urochloa decumbens TaxID=240449 RepID=A0ABC9FPT5_9POAL
MDLNQMPKEFDYDFLDAITANPLFCTQPMTCLDGSNQIESSTRQLEVANQTSGDAFNGPISTSPIAYVDGQSSQRNINGLSLSQPVILDAQDGHGNPHDANVDADSIQGCAVGPGFTEPAALDAQDCNGDDIEDDVWCTPPIPYTGQTFGSKVEARQYYNSYAKRIGFSIRTSTSRLSGDTREQLKVTYVCNKQGRVKQEAQQKVEQIPESDDDDDIQEGSDPDEDDDGAHKKKKKLDGGKKRKREKMQRIDCKARFVVKLIGNRWHAIHFVADHNHNLIVKPSLKKFLRSHKGIPPEEKQIITLLHDTNISTSRVMQLMNMFYGSAQKVPYEGKDVGNFRSGIRRTEKYMDMQETLDYFMELEEEDPDFFHKSFQLGCAFLRDEKTPSYKWLFETFLEAMKGKAPLNIITDKDGAMRNAIALVFRNTCHRNCRWHIMDKFSGMIGPILDEDAELEEDFKECINHTVTPGEFEEKWAAMINKHWLHDNEHFQRLYAIRSSFVPAYYMHNFYPFLQSTQRSEGFNAVLKKYVNPNMSILHFVRQYQKLQEKCLVAEEGQDFRTDDRERRRWSKYPIERHASTVYTKNLFYRFSNEFEKIAEYDVEPKGEFQYLLVPNNTKVYGYGKRSYLVTAIADESSFYCECSKYDRDGILCCHVMKVLTRLGVKTIPEQYIMKRWTLKAVESSDNSTANIHMKTDFIARGMPLNNKKTLWFTNLSTSFAELAADGCLSSERYNIMQDHIKQMRSAINEIKKRKKASRQKEINRPPAASAAQAQAGPSCVDGAAAESVGCLFATAPTAGDCGIPVSVPAAISTPVGNPPRSKVKGRKKEKRLKKGMNVEPKRKNKCRICKKEGHTAPRCPDREGEGVSSVQ